MGLDSGPLQASLLNPRDGINPAMYSLPKFIVSARTWKQDVDLGVNFVKVLTCRDVLIGKGLLGWLADCVNKINLFY